MNSEPVLKLVELPRRVYDRLRAEAMKSGSSTHNLVNILVRDEMFRVGSGKGLGTRTPARPTATGFCLEPAVASQLDGLALHSKVSPGPLMRAFIIAGLKRKEADRIIGKPGYVPNVLKI
jgi:hypothetical protein